jgi:hypothetical protein
MTHLLLFHGRTPALFGTTMTDAAAAAQRVFRRLPRDMDTRSAMAAR